MLSTKPLSNARQSAAYFCEVGAYYGLGTENWNECAKWWGAGATALGLAGTVDKADFKQMLSGELPNGAVLGKWEAGERRHRPGYDLTFNAPKSVSILALVGEDKRLIAAHQQAVTVALGCVERLCAEARVTQAGETQFERTQNLTVATFLQSTSRALDPHLHTHSVVMNATKRVDGAWRALASNLHESSNSETHGFWEQVRYYQRYLGQIYRSELAYQVKHLGYTIHPTQNGCWEIAEVSAKDLTQFSQRRQAIETHLAAHQQAGAKAAALATCVTRPPKETTPVESLKEAWQQRVHTDCVRVRQQAEQRAKQPTRANSITDSVTQAKVLEALSFAIVHQEETHTTLTQLSLCHHALQLQLGEPLSVHALEQGIAALVQQKKLQRVPSGGEMSYYTTPQLIAYEKNFTQNVQHLMQRSNRLHDLKAWTVVRLQPAKTLPKTTQRLMKRVVLTTPGLMTVKLSSLADTASFVTALSQQATACQQRVLILTPTQARHGWWQTQHPSTPVQTLSHFITQSEARLKEFKRYQADNVVALIEHADTVSLKQWQQLTAIAVTTELQIIALKASSHSISYACRHSCLPKLNEAGVPCVRITSRATSSTKQKEKTQDAAADLSSHSPQTAQSNHSKVLATLTDTLKQQTPSVSYDVITTPSEAIPTALAQDTPTASANRLVLVPNQAWVDKVNQALHDKCYAKQQPPSSTTHSQSSALNATLTLPTLTLKPLTAAQQRYAQHYDVADVVRLTERIPVGRWGKTQTRTRDYDITQVNVPHNQLTLQQCKPNTKNRVFTRWRKSPATQTLNLNSLLADTMRLQCFRVMQKTFCLGEPLHVTHTVSGHGLSKGTFMTLTEIHAKRRLLTVQTVAGQRLKLQVDDLQTRHLDYGYAQTLTRYLAAPHPVSHAVVVAPQQRLKKTRSQTQPEHSPSPSSVQPTETSLTPQTPAQLALHFALQATTEQEAVVPPHRVMQQALQYALGTLSPSALVKEVQQAKQSKRVFSTTQAKGWTTPQALQQEQAVIAWVRGQYSYSTRLKRAGCQDPLGLNQEQQRALQGILTSSQRVVNLQGAPGTGKSRLLQTLHRVLTSERVKLTALAPTHAAVKVLTELGFPAHTVQGWCGQAPRVDTPCPGLILIDEASFLSTQQLLHVFQRLDLLATHFPSQALPKLLLIGDKQQIPALQAGAPFALLQHSGVPTFTLKKIQRQNNPHLKAAVQAAYQQNFTESFKHLAPFIEEKKSPTQRLQAASFAYCNNPNALLMTLTNQDRHSLNQHIRQQLQTSGVLTGTPVETSILMPYPLTASERTQLTAYAEGHILRFNQTQHEQSIQAGTYYRIEATPPERGVVTLKAINHPKQTVHWVPPSTVTQAQAIELYQLHTRSVQKGDTLVITRSNPEEGHLSGTRLHVMAVSSQQLTVKDTAGGPQHIDLTQPSQQHWDYGYASTVFQAQGRTTHEAIVYAPSHHTLLVNQVNFLVMISRATHTLTLITDNRDALLQRIQRNTGQKTSSLVATQSAHDIGSSSLAQGTPTSILTTGKEKTNTSSTHQRQATTTPRHTKTNQPSLTTLHETITSQLNAQLPHSLMSLLGEPKAKTPTHYRYGSKQGSLHVQITGDKQGAWYDFQTGDGGWDLISLIQTQQGCDFKQALEITANRLGLTDSTLRALMRNKNPNARRTQVRTQTSNALQQQATLPANSAHATQAKPNKASLTPQQKKMRQLARTVAQQTQPAQGTLVETYLKKHRHITAALPNTLRYHPKLYIKRYNKTFPAMLLPIKDNKGAIQQVHVTLLDRKTANKANVAQAKLKFGPTPKTVHVPLNNQRTQSSITLVAEGIETALSLKTAFPEHSVQTVLDKSGFKRLNPDKLTPHVLLCLDNDLQDFKQDKIIQQTLKKLTQSGKTVRTFMPPAPNNQKTDFNDVLRTQGKAALQQRLAPMLKALADKQDSHAKTLMQSQTPLLQVKSAPERER